MTVFLALLWLSGSAAWANGLSGLKYSTDPNVLLKTKQCGENGLCTNVTTGSFSSLEISVIFGFLNFFLWASDLWFLYKETSWFKMKQLNPTGVGASPYQALRSAMSLSFTAFREPRGVMRIIQFCDTKAETARFDYDYPFRLDYIEPKPVCEGSGKTLRLYGDFSSDAQFFVATGVLSFLYCVGIIVVYLLYEHQYQNNNTWPIAVRNTDSHYHLSRDCTKYREEQVICHSENKYIKNSTHKMISE
ncbi:hypothetical protein B566_EDAN006992 [Ephemera danica]|nr:hypothetical protein B566_EDAN006992 [Ephemera danica]